MKDLTKPIPWLQSSCDHQISSKRISICQIPFPVLNAPHTQVRSLSRELFWKYLLVLLCNAWLNALADAIRPSEQQSFAIFRRMLGASSSITRAFRGLFSTIALATSKHVGEVDLLQSFRRYFPSWFLEQVFEAGIGRSLQPLPAYAGFHVRYGRKTTSPIFIAIISLDIPAVK